MGNRYSKIVFEAEEGLELEAFMGTEGQLIVKAIRAVKEETNFQPQYGNPPIPSGYTHIAGNLKDGFVIERNSDGSQFVWIDVGSLDPDGTLDGENFNQQFGRRNYTDEEFSYVGYNEIIGEELREQIESVAKYKGFYISRFNISKGPKETPLSVRGQMPWGNISFDKAKEIAESMEKTAEVKSHLTYGAEYDSVLAWLIKTENKTLAQIAKNSSSWGNFSDSNSSDMSVAKTGSCEEWCANNIYDLAGNVEEFTQEKYGSSFSTIRGGVSYSKGFYEPVAYRNTCDFDIGYQDVGFRVVLTIKM